MKNSTIKFLIITLSLLTAFIIYSLWADKALTEREFTIKSDRIPASFDGFRIVHISDLHNTTFGKENKKLLNMIEDAQPDIIAVTGDIVDSRRTDMGVALSFLEKALKIAPVYYVTGNHEFRTGQYEALIGDIRALGVTVFENESTVLSKENDAITLCGVNDPYFSSDYPLGDETPALTRFLQELERSDSFTVLLSHRPEFFNLYAEHGFDLVLSGHAHGGQFRLPFIGGFIAPGQGLFPKFDSGHYEKDGTAMIVSRGLGNSIIPLRLFNRPEIITVILETNQTR